MAGGEEGRKEDFSLAAKSYLCGFFAGAANVVSCYPLDALKVRLQSNRPNQRVGMTKVAIKAFRKEGVSWLFRGVTAPTLGTGFETGINYLFFQTFYRHLKAGGDDDDRTHVVKSSLVAGAIAGVPIAFAIGPFELLKVRSQLTKSLNLGSSPRRAAMHILRNDGFVGLLRGNTATLLREIPGNGVYFAVYHGLQKDLGVALAGGIAGIAYWLLVLPADVVKTRMQISSSAKYKSFRGELMKIVRQQGLRGLYSGLTPTLIRAFPANAVQFLAWEYSTRYFNVS